MTPRMVLGWVSGTAALFCLGMVAGMELARWLNEWGVYERCANCWHGRRWHVGGRGSCFGTAHCGCAMFRAEVEQPGELRRQGRL